MARDEAFSPDVDDVHMDDDDDIPRASKKDKGKGKANGAVSLPYSLEPRALG
jgi:hypothetical protein